ncbi:hypothetical protein BDP55DRAFT_420959 [Colletotrichum godetiae]|uniref:Uncharacterized protein n=1 Tax=Colletotrichum godetiae TaxID=1209918 RepID=A0AAJ0A721_9PEZI|nr:uncharacterized protein BDP55DRAFT_420959 [Colletotrichum godetiae]KAK1657688.1 hypothetical protein BDP55DRAFT_420959 [Colletotrichum godetiae]
MPCLFDTEGRPRLDRRWWENRPRSRFASWLLVSLPAFRARQHTPPVRCRRSKEHFNQSVQSMLAPAYGSWQPVSIPRKDSGGPAVQHQEAPSWPLAPNCRTNAEAPSTPIPRDPQSVIMIAGV